MKQSLNVEGGSPGLVVMGDNSCSRGRGFKSWCIVLDGLDIFHIDLFEMTENNRKEVGAGPFVQKKSLHVGRPP